ncbi:hypothetical protein NUU61_008403 [Penicillium alfredii]|uniref:Zn(2)-C6 fungal-type domain-containing protein n=1 Tax=Penicillium alfredii TaxID=1506179 RepID=A0A9W9ESF2_9EURO|nr:uncharacterized protein NUU61_008403 [Penicillium alfredii]KAJ5087096.1 hypothetical protein NUU61_008403 [Penicillium alfredii]
MPGVPSNKACERCKKRHLKCDETRPNCQRCTTAGVDCPGYVQTRKFIDQGATVRRRYAPYQDTHPKPSVAAHTGKTTLHHESESIQNRISQPGSHEQCIQNFSGEENDSSTLHMQMEETRLDVTDNPVMSASSDSSSRPAISTLYNQPPVSSVSDIPSTTEINRDSGLDEASGSTRSTIQSSVSPNAAETIPSFENAYDVIPDNRREYRFPVSSKSLSQGSEKEEIQDIFSQLMTGTEHEIAFLIRHFSEVLGPWGMFTSPATMEMYPNATQVDWFLKAANYYYLTASELNNATSDGYTTVSSSAVLEPPIETVSRWLRSQSIQAGLKPTSTDSADISLLRRTEEMVVTVALLTFYRLLDANGDEWHMHLSGIRSLFDCLLQAHVAPSAVFAHGIRAAFWNFARQDYLGCYFTRLPTRLDPGNLPLWRAAGISIDEQEEFHIIANGPIYSPQEDQAANGLIWLVSKVINFLAKSKQSQLAQWAAGLPSPDMGGTSDNTGQPRTQTRPLGSSFASSFRPGLTPSRKPSGPANHQLPFPEVFHGLTTCAVAMQHYHFGRLALLLNRPPDVVNASSTAFDRLQGYREVTKEVEYRSREVCGIALGRPQGGVRIYMIPLLYAVGQCLETPDEHRIIVDLLRGIEADLGWATEYAVQKLQAVWHR